MKMFSLLVVSALLATVAMLFKEQGITVLVCLNLTMIYYDLRKLMYRNAFSLKFN